MIVFVSVVPVTISGNTFFAMVADITPFLSAVATGMSSMSSAA